MPNGPRDKTLGKDNRTLTQLVMALLMPWGEAGKIILKADRPTTLRQEVWDEARFAIRSARNVDNSTASPLPSSKPRQRG